MTDRTRTPGPWHVMPTSKMADCNDDGPVAGVFDDDDGEPGVPIGTAATDADARLMAAAPDLLEALEEARLLMTEWRGKLYIEATARLDLNEAIDHADAAIAKATGE